MLQLKPLDQKLPIFQQINRAAFNHPEFKQALGHYPSSAVASPHLFTRLTVPNLCVGP